MIMRETECEGKGRTGDRDRQGRRKREKEEGKGMKKGGRRELWFSCPRTPLAHAAPPSHSQTSTLPPLVKMSG